ncbi:MAG: flavin reductase (DIM6/NTAB) family NADH-FMN oxidoreductase RutF [Verrucomicrobiales bacterium]|jgi:flavin reductase (DIM6/NTAB) family NADH-FMN oxidoreductase RutF
MNETIDPKFFRQVMGQVPTCVTVVTALVDDAPQAMVIGSFVSVSLDPPLAGFFCTSTSFTWQTLRRADVLGVNVLGDHQIDISNACMREPDVRLEGLDWEMVDGAPQVAGGTAWMTLTENQIVDAGDHQFGLYNVVTMDVPDTPITPVIFYGGGYRSLAPVDED